MPTLYFRALKETVQFVTDSSKKHKGRYWPISHDERVSLIRLGILGEPSNRVKKQEYLGQDNVTRDHWINVYPVNLERVAYLSRRLEEISEQRGSDRIRIDLNELSPQ